MGGINLPAGFQIIDPQTDGLALPDGFEVVDAPLTPPGLALPEGFEVVDAPTPATVAPVLDTPPAEFNPDGTAVGRAIERGILRLEQTGEAAAMQRNASVLADATGMLDVPRQMFLEATGLPNVPRGVDVSTPEKTFEEIARRVGPAAAQNFLDVYKIRDENARAARGEAQTGGSLTAANPISAGQATERGAGNALEIARLRQEIAALPGSESNERMRQTLADTPDEVLATLGAMVKDPVGAGAFLGETALESAPQLTATTLAALLTRNPGIVSAMTAAGAAAQEYGSSVDEFLQEQGVTLQSPEDARALLTDNDLLTKANERGMARALVVAAFEMAGQGLAGKLGSGVRGTLADTGVQAATGMGGEASARAATGQDMSAREILVEGLAEGVTAPIEVGAQLYANRKSTTEAANNGSNTTTPTAAPSTPAAPAPVATPATPAPQTPPADVTPAPTSASTSTPTADPAPGAPSNPNRARVYTPDNEQIEVETQVVEADSLLTSDQQGYPQELQPRDRSRAASESQIESIANAPNPDRLDQSPESDRGAPIIAPDGSVVESGNGRVMGLRRAYERGTADAYRQHVLSRFPEAANMRNPVLIRRRITDVDAQNFTVASNQSATLAMSATETAQTDARLVDDEIVSLYRGGDILGANNRDMVRAFIGRLPQSAQGSLVTAEGGLSVDGQRRFEAAMFASAYGDQNLLSRLTERTDDDMKSVTNALRSAAPAVVRLKSAITRGEVSPDVDITSHVVAAMHTLADIRARETNLRDHRAQQDAFAQPLSPVSEAILDAFYNDPGTRLASQRDMQAFLEDYTQSAMEQKIDQATLPGVDPAPLKNAEQIANETLDAKRNATPDTGDLFGDAAEQSADGTPRRVQPDPRGAEERQPANGRRGREAGEPLADATGRRGSPSGNTPGGSHAGVSQTRAPRGAMTPRTREVSFTSKGAIDEQAYVDAGFTRDQGALLKPAQKKAALARVLENKFGLKIDYTVRGAKIATLDAVDQMLDAYRGIRFMLHTLALPEGAISLNGTLTLALEKFNGRYFGAYNPRTKTIHMPGRSNSFAHEWMHALDHMLRDALAPQAMEPLLSRIARGEGLDPNDGVQAAYVNLIYKMFFDDADLAAQMLRLESEANATIKNGPNAGQPTKAALTAQRQLDELRSGMTRIKIAPTTYRQNATDFGGGGSNYWNSVHEMLARAFEAYIGYKVETAGGPNAFITKGDAAYLSDADTRLAKTFPKGAERMAIFAAFDELFDHIRGDAMLGAGAQTARPTDANLTNKNYYLNMLRTLGDTTMVETIAPELKSMVVGLKNLVAHPVQSLRNTTAIVSRNLGVNQSYGSPAAAVGAALSYTTDGFRMLFYSVRGHVKTIIARQPAEAQPFFEYLAEQLMTDPGTGKQRPETALEETNRIIKKTATRIEAALKVSGLVGWLKSSKANPWAVELSQADNDIVRELMFGNGHPDATKAHEALAAELRRIMDDFWRVARDAGLQVGYVEDKGYLTRTLLPDAVERNRSGFLTKASEVYRLQFDRLVENIELADLLKLASAVSRRVWGFESTTASKGPFAQTFVAARQAGKDLKTATGELKAAKLAHRANPTPATQADVDAAQDAVDAARDTLASAMDDLKADIRQDYSSQAADAWLDKIVRGDSMAFDSLGPAADFLKARTLPSEADAILADFYETDVIQNVMNYAMHTSARAGYVQRFGQTGGNRKFQDIIGRGDIEQTVASNPTKYNRDTPVGRLAIIRDLADRSVDNVAELMLEQAKDAGAAGNDIRKMRETVELLTGRSGRGFGHNSLRAVASFFHVWGTVMLLGKAAFSSIAEPITVGLRTRSTKATLRTFTTYLSEAVRTMDSVQDRAMLAKAMGLIASPLYDVTMMSRSGFDPKDALSGSTVVSRFHRATGLAQITNASRRAVMVGGTFWLRDLAAQYLDPNTPAKRLEQIKGEFRDLGFTDEQMTDMADWLAPLEQLPDVDALDTPQGQLFEKAINRFVNQTIQEPNQSDKPALAATPIGKLSYALTSFLFSFYRNIHLATVNRMKQNYQIGRDLGESKLRAGADAAGAALATFGLGFGALFAGQLAVTVVREAIFNQDQWDKHDENDDLEKWLMQIALSRTGVFGPGDVINNMLTGLRYERDLTSLATGPYIASPLSHVQNILKGMPRTELWEGGPGVGTRNSPNTNTAEHTAAKSAYLLLVAPALNVLASGAETKGPVGWAARWTLMQYLGSYTAAGDFANATAGSRE